MKKKTVILRLTALAAGLALVLGTLQFFSKQKPSFDGELVDVVFPKSYAFTDDDTWFSVRKNNPIEDEFISAINTFSYKTSATLLGNSKGNINYSPLSLYYPLALSATGARGETQAQLLELLGVMDSDTLSLQCGNLYRQLYSDNEIGKLKIANSLWIDDRLAINKSFAENAAKNFYASSINVDFSDKETSKKMADWIANNTNANLTPEIKISSQQIMSIINTVYFKDEWMDRFDKSKTAEDSFNLSDGNTVSCDFMNTTYGSHSFSKGEGFTRSSLDLKNHGQMVFILPDKGISPKELLSSPDKMQEIFEGEESGNGEVIWKIPKFSFGSELELMDQLKALGISSVFTENANFSGITPDQAFIGGVSQQSHIAIDENGVEAAAFTQINYAGAMLPTDKAEMILDRPFIYGIKSFNGTLLFVGICENPTLIN